MSKSILQEDKTYCYVHQKYLGIDVFACHEHHVIYGSANRKWSEKYGLKIYVCLNCHNAIHHKHFHDADLHKIAEQAWLDYYNKTIEDWIRVFGKNYLD